MPRKLTIQQIADEADISKSTVERCLKAGWCPPPDEEVQLGRGGSKQRIWRRETVTEFIARARRAKLAGRAISDEFGP